MSTKKVAVIGGGAAGLVAARELIREGHEVVIFEREAQLGGTWVYTPETESDPVGLDPNRKIVHSSLYDSLRTNLRRELMGFRDFPFVASEKPNRDPRRHPNHQEVLHYLEDFASEFRLKELIRYQTEVLYVGVEKDGEWKVKSWKSTDYGKEDLDETYDAVVVCVGQYTEPKIADFPGIKIWPGRQCHSHNYRTPEAYRDQIVIVIGGSSSAIDVCKDIRGVAKEVHVACRSERARNILQRLGYDNLFVHPMIERADDDGRVAFEDGSEVIANVILHCTGYKYKYPFLHIGNAVNVDDNRVGPLYKHVFPPALAPGISFVGIPNFVIPFIHFELQSTWIAGVLSGRISLPSEEIMMEDVKDFYSKLEAADVPKHDTHKLGDFQFELEDWLAKECGRPSIQEWRKEMFQAGLISLITQPDSFRDELSDNDQLYLQAHEEFKQYLLPKQTQPYDKTVY